VIDLFDRPGLYVHIPFCRRRCAYCSFASGVYAPADAEAYLGALRKEGDERARGRAFGTVYLGGGTPTVLPDDRFAALLEMVRAWLPEPPVEWTVEANPGTLTPGKIAAMTERGVHRLSLGVQTFRPEGYTALGRAGTPEEVAEALGLARASGLEWSLDLISGWAGQTDAAWEEDLRLAGDSGANHVSVYALTLEADSPLARRGMTMLDNDAERRRWDAADRLLGEAGLRRYETGNFARPGFEAKHNLGCWRGGDSVGLGASAQSHERGRRFANVSDAAEYVRRMDAADAAATRRGAEPPPGRGAEDFTETLAPDAKAREGFVFWLRLRAGVPVDLFARRFGRTPEALYGTALAEWLERGALLREGGVFRLSDERYPVADEVFAALV
jgi:oxygen-independent coproporphyrinogen-3 oxidase